jgi:galactokinase
LRDVSLTELEEHRGRLDPVVFKRAEHVIGENERVLAARGLLRTNDIKRFGELMFASHESSRVNFENSCEELDFIVKIASGLKEVFGARLSGGGFGGSAVLCVRPEDAAGVDVKISSAYAEKFGSACAVSLAKPSAGARLVSRQEKEPC